MKFKDWQHLERKASWEDMIRTTLGQRLRATLLLEENHPRPGGSGLPTLRCLHASAGGLPLLSNKGDVELVSLELLPGIGHHLIEGSLQQVVSTNDEPRNEKPCGRAARAWAPMLGNVLGEMWGPRLTVSLPRLFIKVQIPSVQPCTYSDTLFKMIKVPGQHVPVYNGTNSIHIILLPGFLFFFLSILRRIS